MPSFSSSTLSRRVLLQRAAAVGLTIPAATVLLAACGSDEDDDATATTVGEATAATTPGTTSTATSSTEETPATGQTPTTAAGQEPNPDNPLYYGYEIEPAQNQGGTSVMLMHDDLYSVNPLHYSGFGDGALFNVMAFVYQAMSERHPTTGEIMPLLATSWEASEDGITWTFSLRESVAWHDGEPLTADDVVFTYEMHANEAVQSFSREFIVESVESVEAQDERTVVLTATAPNSEFLTITLEWLVAEHVWSGVDPAGIVTHDGSTGIDPTMVIGTGPFTFVERVVQDHATVARNDAYWDGRPILDEIIFQYVADLQSFEGLLRTGELEYGWIPFTSGAQFTGLDTTTLYEFPALSMMIFALNLDSETTTLFQDQAVRQALVYALDRQAMIEGVFQGYGDVANTLLIPGLWNNDEENVTVSYPYDPEMANQLLDEAGWAMGDDGVREKDGVKLSFECLGDDFYEPLMATAQEFWRQVGIDMQPTLVTGTVLQERYLEHDYVMTAWTIGATGYDDLSWVLDSEMYPGGGNRMKYSNERVDELLDMLREEFDPELRVPLFTEIQNIALEEVPFVPVIFDYDLRVVGARLHNVYPGPYNTTFNAETWWVDA
jgi:peptide/nickel transport system substrate-binding protein